MSIAVRRPAVSAVSVVAGFDCIHINVGSAPRGAQLGGYTTGTPDIRWTSKDWASRPGAVRIDQDFAASDPSADVLDVENGAATFGDCPVWAMRALTDFNTAARPGQRSPAIYASQSSLTGVCDALIRGGVRGGVGLWVANWNLSQSQAIALIQNAAGPFPIVAVQYGDGTWGDFDVFSAAWLTRVSGKALAVNPVAGLAATRRGYTSIDLGWKTRENAQSYSVHTYWRGTEVETQVTSGTTIRVRNLKPLHTYTFKVRAHPGGSTGADASIKATTR